MSAFLLLGSRARDGVPPITRVETPQVSVALASLALQVGQMRGGRKLALLRQAMPGGKSSKPDPVYPTAPPLPPSSGRY